MHVNLTKNLEKIVTAFGKTGKLPKALMKYGCIVFLVLLAAGSILALLNMTVFNYDSYMDLVSKSLVKTSFSIAAEAVIGGLVLDFVFKR